MNEKKGYQEVHHEGKLMAIILSKDYSNEKTTFFSQPEFSQQLGYIVYGKGGVIKAHFHKEAHRKITYTQEVLFIRKGKLTINFYTTGKKFITSRELSAGDIIFLCSGGHGFKMTEDTEIIEVKQGPYSGHDSDKECFEGIENDTCK